MKKHRIRWTDTQAKRSKDIFTFKEFCKIEEESTTKRIEKTYQKTKTKRISRNFSPLEVIGRFLIDSPLGKEGFVFTVGQYSSIGLLA